jgi:hypothetical protein
MFCQAMRTQILENCIQSNSVQLLAFKEYTQQRAFNDQVQAHSEVVNLLADEHTSDILNDAFERTNKYFRKGILGSFFFFFAFYTLFMSLVPIMIESADRDRLDFGQNNYRYENLPSH